MIVSEVMTKDAATCWADDDLNRAVQIMWERDCGVVPVVDLAGHVVGIVTDRDACMAAYTQGKPLNAIRTGDVMSRQVVSCDVADPIETAEATMRTQKVRRLPVLDAEGRLVGIVSLNDLARRAARERGRHADRLALDVAATLAGICQPWCEVGEAPQPSAVPARKGPVLVPVPSLLGAGLRP